VAGLLQEALTCAPVFDLNRVHLVNPVDHVFEYYNTRADRKGRMKQYNLCFLGFGNVGRALARLLIAKSAELRENFTKSSIESPDLPAGELVGLRKQM